MEQEEDGLGATGGEGIGEGYIISLTQEKTIPHSHK